LEERKMSVTDEKTAAEWIDYDGDYWGGLHVCERSIRLQRGYGLQAIGITRGQIQSLLDGKVLTGDVQGVYGIILHLKD
jgi:hypothetical protein